MTHTGCMLSACRALAVLASSPSAQSEIACGNGLALLVDLLFRPQEQQFALQVIKEVCVVWVGEGAVGWGKQSVRGCGWVGGVWCGMWIYEVHTLHFACFVANTLYSQYEMRIRHTHNAKYTRNTH